MVIDNLDSLTYEQYIANFIVYLTQQDARASGYEAHHIIPKSSQKPFIFDDRCIRVTAFEHIIAHYLLAKQYGGDFIRIFCLMLNYNFNKASLIEHITLADLKYFAELREIGFRKISNQHKGKPAHNKGSTLCEEARQKLSQAHQGFHWWTNGVEERLSLTKPEGDFKLGRLPFTEAKKQNLRLAHLGKSNGPCKEETKQKIRAGNLNRQTNKHWYTNGIDTVLLNTCPEGYWPGRTYSKETLNKMRQSHILN